MANESGNVEGRKYIKQLENQVIKFKRLIQNALELSGSEEVRNDKQSLREAIEKLEEEKIKLEEELNLVEDTRQGSGILQSVVDLEAENVGLKAKFEEVLGEVEKENQQINELKKENQELSQILQGLEKEKSRLLEKIKKIRENTDLRCETVAVQERAPETENRSNAEPSFGPIDILSILSVL